MKKLWDNSDGEVEGRHLKQFTANQYVNEVLHCVQERVTPEINEALLAPFTGDGQL